MKPVREKILAFRLHNQALHHRLPAGSLLQASAGGIRNTPPGSAELAFLARLEKFSPPDLDKACSDKILLEVWSIRNSPFFHPVQDSLVFTLGLLPTDEASLRFYMKTVLPIIDKAGISATAALDLTAAALLDALDGRRLAKGELSTEVSRRIPPQLNYWCKACGASHLNETLLRIAAQKTQVCIVSRIGPKVFFGRSEQWLGRPFQMVDQVEAGAEVLRRYLRGYGPSTSLHFGIWAGISPAQAHRIWQSVRPEMAEVDYDGSKSWLLEVERAGFSQAELPEGVRFLPPYDSYLLLSDRETLLPDKNKHSQVWRALSNPGVLLANGEAAGIWRARKKGKILELEIEPFLTFSGKLKDAVEAEAATLAPFRGCAGVELDWKE